MTSEKINSAFYSMYTRELYLEKYVWCFCGRKFFRHIFCWWT